MREVAQQREQALAVRRPERRRCGRPRRVEERDVHRHHQQAVTRHGRQVGRQEGELVLAQAADVSGLLARSVHDVVEYDEGRFRFLPRVCIRPEMAPERAQRILVAPRIEIEVVVAWHVQPRHAEPRGGGIHRRIQRKVVVDDVAERQAQSGAVVAHQRLDDVAFVMADIDHRLRLRIAEHQYVQRRGRGVLQRQQCEITTGRQRCGNAAMRQRGARLRLHMAPEIGQAVVAARKPVRRRLDHEHRPPGLRRQRVASPGVGHDQPLAIGDVDAGKSRLAWIAPTIPVGVLEHGALVAWRRGRGEARPAGQPHDQESQAGPDGSHRPIIRGGPPRGQPRWSRRGTGGIVRPRG